MSFAGFEGSGSALHHIAWGHLTVRSVLTLGVPTLVRGEHANDKYEAERKMTWSELFFDLIFVTGVRRLGDMMREGLGDDETPTAKEGEGAEPDAEPAEEGGGSLTFQQYTVLFFVLWALWVDQANYGTRWGVNDLYNFLHFGLFMAGIVVVVSSLGTGVEQIQRLYCAMCFSYFIGVLASVRIVVHYPLERQAAKYGYRELVLHAVKVGVCLAGYAAATSEHWLVPCYVLAAMPHVTFPLLIVGHRLGLLPSSHIPFHIEHYAERMSLLMVIYLGDGVDNLTSGSGPGGPPIKRFAAGFALLLVLKVLLLDSCEVETADHAIRRGPLATWVFGLAMPLQAFGLALVSSGLALALRDDGDGAHADAQQLLAGGTAIVLGAFFAASLAHRPPNHDAVAHSSCRSEHATHVLEVLRCAYVLQRILAAAVFAACVAIAALDLELFLTPFLLLLSLTAMLALLAVVNLIDEYLEGRLHDIETHESSGGGGDHTQKPIRYSAARQPSFSSPSTSSSRPREYAEALATLTELAANDAELHAHASAALAAVPSRGPSIPSPAGGYQAPLLTASAAADPERKSLDAQLADPDDDEPAWLSPPRATPWEYRSPMQ